MSDDYKELCMWYFNLAKLQSAISDLQSLHYSLPDDDPMIDKGELQKLYSRLVLWQTRLEVHISSREHVQNAGTPPDDQAET